MELTDGAVVGQEEIGVTIVEHRKLGARLIDGEVSDVLVASDQGRPVFHDAPRSDADADHSTASEARRSFRNERIAHMASHARVRPTGQDPGTSRLGRSQQSFLNANEIN